MVDNNPPFKSIAALVLLASSVFCTSAFADHRSDVAAGVILGSLVIGATVGSMNNAAYANNIVQYAPYPQAQYQPQYQYQYQYQPHYPQQYQPPYQLQYQPQVQPQQLYQLYPQYQALPQVTTVYVEPTYVQNRPYYVQTQPYYAPAAPLIVVSPARAYYPRFAGHAHAYYGYGRGY